MQALLASLVVSMSVKDSAYKAGMASARAEARKTGQDFEQSADTMAGAMLNAAREINRAMVGIVDSIASSANNVRNSALAMTAAVTVPLTLMGKSAKDTAAAFEGSMNRVHTAFMAANPEQLNALSEAAMRMGPAFRRSAGEAASAIEVLGKNGLDAAQVLGGALESALTLATIGNAGLSDAADLTTDIMQQFGKTSRELPGIVDKVTGALDVSKLSFDDYRLAIGQAGGVAGGLGYQFEDLNVALAASASLFASGSDAGTSFKTFLTSLVPQSEDAARVMRTLGFEFFDATGKAKPLAEIADELNTKMSMLSDRSRSDALRTIFGTDAMRTAISLMVQGSAGLSEIQQKIDAIRAQDKVDIIQQGDIDATLRLSTAMEQLAIQFGNVLLPITAAIKNGLAAVVQTVASAPPWFFKLGTAIGLLVSSIGPLTLAALMLAKIALPLLLLRLGPVALGIAALVNPVGVVLRLVVDLAIKFGVLSAASRVLGLSLSALTGPIGLVITALLIFLPLLSKSGQTSAKVKELQDALNQSNEQAQSTLMRLAMAQGKARDEALKLARAQQAQARAAVVAAQANEALARSAALLAIQKSDELENGALRSMPWNLWRRADAAASRDAAVKNYQQFAQIYGQSVDQYAQLTDAINAAELMGGTVDMDFSKPDSERSRRDRNGRDAAADEARFQDELGQLRVNQLRAYADLTGAIEAEYVATTAQIEEERAAYVRQLAADEGLTEAKRTQLLAAKEAELQERFLDASQRRDRDLARDAFDIASAQNDAAQDILRSQIDLADSAAERRRLEERLLDLQKRQEAAQIELVLATEDPSRVAYAKAVSAKATLDQRYGTQSDRIARDNETPMQSYFRSLSRSAEAVNEAIEGINVGAMDRLNVELVDAAFGVGSLESAFGNLWKNVLKGLADMAVQMYLIKPLAQSLFGGGGGLLGGIGGLLGGSKAVAGGLKFGGGKAVGGRVEPGSWYMVGEDGPEPFIPDQAGTIVPNGGLSKIGGGGGGGDRSVVELRLRDEMLDARIVQGSVAVVREAAPALTQAAVAETAAQYGRPTL